VTNSSDPVGAQKQGSNPARRTDFHSTLIFRANDISRFLVLWQSALASNLDFSHAAAGLARAATAAGGAIRIAERVQRTGDFVS
jgi:hypothetical protein